jgi:cell filamentation protein
VSRYSGLDEYIDPISGVLKNRFGIVDATLLSETEADLAAARSRELALTPLKGKFDLAHLQATHKYLFGDLYDWAGQLRSVDISKNGHVFAHHAHLAAAAHDLFSKLATERCLAGLDLHAFASRAAYFFSEINALHPFREGNGRTQREFFSFLALRNGYYLAWEQLDQARMLQASIESFHGDLRNLTLLFCNISEAAPG